MRNDLTELVFILDRSGSMHGLEGDTVGGFNSVLESNRSQPGDANVTTVLFNHEPVLLHDRLPIGAVRPITQDDYRAGGGTALLDAIGLAIDKIVAVQRSVSEEHRAGKVQFVIITDGYENSSTRYTLREIRKKIDHEQSKYGWDFLFLGANIDGIAAAGELGIRPERAVSAINDAQGVAVQFGAVAMETCAYRCAPAGVRRGAAWKQLIEEDAARGV